jgi:PD-(D/E)XK nuclease superfamily
MDGCFQGHGLDDAFLKRLLRKAIDNLSVAPPIGPLTLALADFSDARVYREWRDIDLLIESKSNNLVFAIENKIDSSEGKNQLQKYRAIVESRYPHSKTLFSYLTVEGDIPSDDVWVPLSYSDIIDSLGEAKSHNSSKLTAEATTVIDHYIGLVRRNIVPDQELIEQCKKLYDLHRDAIDWIIKYGITDTFSSASDQFFKDHTELRSFATRPKEAVFLTKALCDVVPEIEGMNWFGQSRPFLMWFNLRIEGKLGLVFEVGPLSNSKFDREALVKGLLAIFKRQQQISPKYTRVYSEYKPLTDDQADDFQVIISTMEALYKGAIEHVAAVTDYLADFFGNK